MVTSWGTSTLHVESNVVPFQYCTEEMTAL